MTPEPDLATAPQKRPVLVVEDDHDVRVSVRSILEDEGFQVLSAANGRQAIDLLQQFQPGLILLDLRMPIMDGWEFVELLRRDAVLARLPVVIHSAFHELAPADVEVLAKPVDARVLVELAHKHCG